MNNRKITDWPYPEIEVMWKADNNAWLETCEDTFWDQLECVPPAAMKYSAFAVGEPYTHHNNEGAIHAMFIEVDGRYFCKMGSIKKFNYHDYEREVIDQITDDL